VASGKLLAVERRNRHGEGDRAPKKRQKTYVYAVEVPILASQLGFVVGPFRVVDMQQLGGVRDRINTEVHPATRKRKAEQDVEDRQREASEEKEEERKEEVASDAEDVGDEGDEDDEDASEAAAQNRAKDVTIRIRAVTPASTSKYRVTSFLAFSNKTSAQLQAEAVESLCFVTAGMRDIMTCYNECLESNSNASYPYGVYKQVFVDHAYKPSMSFSGFSILSSSLLHRKTVIDQTYHTRYTLALALARSWMQSMLLKSPADLWLAEGFARHLTFEYLKRAFGMNHVKWLQLSQTQELCNMDALPSVVQMESAWVDRSWLARSAATYDDDVDDERNQDENADADVYTDTNADYNLDSYADNLYDNTNTSSNMNNDNHNSVIKSNSFINVNNDTSRLNINNSSKLVPMDTVSYLSVASSTHTSLELLQPEGGQAATDSYFQPPRPLWWTGYLWEAELYSDLRSIKAGLLMNTIRDAITPSNFAHILRKCLRQDKDPPEALSTAAVLNQMGAASGKDDVMQALAKNWVYAYGYPLISVEFVHNRKKKHTQLTFHQLQEQVGVGRGIRVKGLMGMEMLFL
jgi:hypothetical protein